MEKDLTEHRSSYFSGMMSPSCFPVAHDDFHYSRIHHHRHRRNLTRWRSIFRKLVRESRTTFYGSNKPPTTTSFQYDPVSYSQNFDDGSHHHNQNQPRRLSHAAFQDVRWVTQINKLNIINTGSNLLFIIFLLHNHNHKYILHLVVILDFIGWIHSAKYEYYLWVELATYLPINSKFTPHVVVQRGTRSIDVQDREEN